nr:MAG: putative capsid protein [Arizlama virus]
MPPQRKRKRSNSSYNTPYKKRKTYPRTAYQGSMVPLRTGGYRPNNVERKVNDLTVATYNVNSTGSVTLLALPTVGADFNNRIGRKITLKSVYIRGFGGTEWALTSGAPGLTLSAPSQLHRMMIVFDLQPNGAAPAVTDILVTSSPSSQLNLNNRDRFKIICDKTWTVGPVTQSAALPAVHSGDPQQYVIKKYKKLNLEMIFNAGGAGTIADVNSGALYMVWVGSATSGTNTDGVATLSTRVRYSDN